MREATRPTNSALTRKATKDVIHLYGVPFADVLQQHWHKLVGRDRLDCAMATLDALEAHPLAKDHTREDYASWESEPSMRWIGIVGAIGLPAMLGVMRGRRVAILYGKDRLAALKRLAPSSSPVPAVLLTNLELRRRKRDDYWQNVIAVIAELHGMSCPERYSTSRTMSDQIPTERKTGVDP